MMLNILPTSFGATNLEVSIAAEPLFKIGSLTVTNALLTGAIATGIMAIVLWYVVSRVKRGKYNRFVGLFQWVFEGLTNQIRDIIPDPKLARKITPLAISIFFFVLFNYWMSVIPGVGSITFHGHPLFRAMTADLNFTLGLALVTVVVVQAYAIKYLGVFGSAGRYVKNPFKNPIGAFEGLLELIGEFSRGLALALRLFGNAFAGEVLLIIVGILTGYLAAVALPVFMGFELFIGFIQAYVFFVLTLIFTSLAVTSHGPALEHGSSVDTPKKGGAHDDAKFDAAHA
jgi:F-type H+-transporting ATPase subunit a